MGQYRLPLAPPSQLMIFVKNHVTHDNIVVCALFGHAASKTAPWVRCKEQFAKLVMDFSTARQSSQALQTPSCKERFAKLVTGFATAR